MHIRYPRIYAAFKAYGFSPAKTVEIMIDASRGDDYALSFVRVVFSARRAAA